MVLPSSAALSEVPSAIPTVIFEIINEALSCALYKNDTSKQTDDKINNFIVLKFISSLSICIYLYYLQPLKIIFILARCHMLTN